MAFGHLKANLSGGVSPVALAKGGYLIQILASHKIFMKKYRPHKIESKWQKKWQEVGFPQAEDLDRDREKFYALVEFPYPSGKGLHMGHAFTFVIMDVLARKKRMEGKNVLYPMGWDAFGLPTENYAIRTGIHPRNATKQNTARFKEQMLRLALDYNWDREVNTTNPAYYRWTQWIFLQLFKYGLAFKEEKPINWCPSCKIGLANEEVIEGRCERCGAEVTQKNLSQWMLNITAYAERLADDLDKVDFPSSVKAAQRNWIGRTEGITIEYPLAGCEKSISCYTTRPDTNFGATFIVLAPEHELLKNNKLQISNDKLQIVKNYIEESKKKSELERTELSKEKTGVFTGLYALNRLTGKKLPIWVADFVVPTAGTGAVVGVPAHDQRDYDFANKYNLDIIPVIKPKEGDWDFSEAPYTEIEEGLVFNSDFLNGLEVEEAMDKVMDYLEEKGWGERSINYHLRDWIFSRQHYWGEPIPMVYCPQCAEKGISWFDLEEAREYEDFGTSSADSLFKAGHRMNFGDFSQGLAGWFPLSEDKLPLELPDVARYEPTDTGESPLANIESWVTTSCPHCGGPARRETDTMPNWAGSSWYFLRYCDPCNNERLADYENMEYWLPVDIYEGGAEHTTLHLLYSRFWHKFLNDIGAVPYAEPYQKRREHGVILAEDGKQMSKSRGNVIDPLEIIEQVGADSLRTYLLFMGPYDETIPWNMDGLQGCSRFLGRVNKLTGELVSSFADEERMRDSDAELKRKLHRLTKKVGEDVDNMKYNTAIAAMMEFLNDVQKPLINADSETDSRRLSTEDWGKFLRLLAPFAPHITEELWQRICENPKKNQRESQFSSIHEQPWPEYDPKLVEKREVTIVVQVNGKLRGAFQTEPGLAKDSAVGKAKALDKVNKYLVGKDIKKVIWVEDRLLNFVVL